MQYDDALLKEINMAEHLQVKIDELEK